MSTRRTKVKGSLKHTHYIEGSRGNVKVKTVFPSSSPNIPHLSQSPKKSSQSLPEHNEDQVRQEIDQEIMFMDPDIVPNFGTKSTNDYLREWGTRRALYLDEILERESPPSGNICDTCGNREGTWKCEDCLGNACQCTDCCRLSHRRHPFHRVESWTGSYFSPSWLWKVGTVIHLGHNGSPCPGMRWDSSDKEGMGAEIIPDDQSAKEKCPEFAPLDEDDIAHDLDDFSDCDEGLHDDNDIPDPPISYLDGLRVLTFVHTNGIHQLPTSFCQCPGAPDMDIQLLRMGLFPSTSIQPQTAFTFKVLDDYLLENLECKTSATHYYSKLRRLTSKGFPYRVKDRYRELLRTSRQWRSLKEYKWFGFGHQQRKPGPGELGLFCTACPQPGINLPDNWKEDPEQWAYSRGFVLDGNFSCNHKAQRRPETDVWLKNGEGYMVEKTRYKEHLLTAKEVKEPPTCNEHHAVNDKARIHKGCDSTGLGATACLRHGCYCPGGVVDFQKGERQMNMDYAICQAMKNTKTEQAPKCILVYDVNCQYHKNFFKRVEESPYLEVHPGLIIIPGIGLFHVHGHQLICLARFSPTFIEGAGQSDGEILETLWSTLNHVGRISRTMTLAHRTEVLDSHMGDNNWKKLVNMVTTLCRKWKKVTSGLADAESELKKLSETADLEQVTAWNSQMDEAEEKRLTDLTAMDIYEAEAPKVPTQKDIQAELMGQEYIARDSMGVTLWVSTGIKIQEAQLALSRSIRMMGRQPTADDKVDLAKRRQRFLRKMDAFDNEACELFPGVDFLTEAMNIPPLEDGYEHEDDLETLLANPPSANRLLPESMEVVLPSSFINLPEQMSIARQREIDLRIAQANDTLAAIRLEIGHKSFIYRKQINIQESKKGKTRAYAQVNTADRNLAHHLRVYSQARWALSRLCAPAEVLRKFQIIQKKDTHTLPNISKPNGPGHRNLNIPWFWGMNIHVYRVSYMRAKARRDRWLEEYKLVPREMSWTMLYFLHKAKEWDKLAENKSPGKECYARRQAGMWRAFQIQALADFQRSGAV